MKITTESLELRVLELEDAVSMITRVLETVSVMLGGLNEISRVQATLIGSLRKGVEDANPDDVLS